jgi:hypothetical protein
MAKVQVPTEAVSFRLKEASLSLYNNPKTDRYGVVMNCNNNNNNMKKI